MEIKKILEILLDLIIKQVIKVFFLSSLYKKKTFLDVFIFIYYLKYGYI